MLSAGARALGGRRPRLVVLAAGMAVVGVMVLLWLPVREQGVALSAYTSNAGELTGEALFGQTFRAERDRLSAVAVKFATYAGRDNTREVVFHLRRSTAGGEDLRTARVPAGALGDNQFYRFDFEPVAGSGGQTFFFYVTSPGSTRGDAVTVDLSNADPYPLGSAYLVRERASLAADDAAELARAGKQAVDLSFASYYSVPLHQAVRRAIWEAGRALVATWDERRGEYYVWLLAAVPSAVFLAFGWQVGRREQRGGLSERLVRGSLWALLAAALLLRLLYAMELPMTNDEGNYLYDARMLLEGRLARGDGYVKALLVVLWFALWEALTGRALLAGRLASVVASSLTLLPLYSIGRHLAGRTTGLLSAAAWALFGAPVVTGIYAHTQPLALLLGASGIAVLLSAVRGAVPPAGGRLSSAGAGAARLIRQRAFWLVAAGVLLGMGVISRKSVVALGLVPMFLILFESGSWRQRLRSLLLVGSGFAAVVALLLTLAAWMYGPLGITEALGVNSAADGQEAVEPGQEEQVRAYSIRGMTPFFRESLPLIWLAALGWGAALEALALRMAARRLRAGRVAAAAAAWVLPAAWFYWAWGFFAEYEGETVMALFMARLWPAMAMMLLVLVLALRLRAFLEAENLWRRLTATAVPVLWFGGLVYLYLNWLKFHANYLVEFLPPLTLLAGMGLAAALHAWHSGAARRVLPGQRVVRRGVVVALLAVLFWAMAASGYVTYAYPHTGTFEIAAVREAAVWARAHIPLEEPIFTGAGLIPYLSGHRVTLDIAHPRWYAYPFVWERSPRRLASFLTSREDMLEAYRQAQWFLLEKQTSFSFLMEYSEIEAGLERDWERVHGVSNGSNTLTFYRRVRAANELR